MRFAFVLGATETAAIDGISAAGAEPELRRHTPAADAELVEFGRTVRAPVVPVSPAGCPTPAVVTRAVRELVGFDPLFVDAGLDAPTAAPTVEVGAEPGGDIREPEPVPRARRTFEETRRLGRRLPDRELVVGESVPGGTTTALGVLGALGEPYGVSSSLPENPIGRKDELVSTGLAASGLEEGELAGEPIRAVRAMGDPVLAALTGLVAGAAAAGIDVTLAGGTQLIAAAALLRHAGVDAPVRLATTAYVADDPAVDLDAAARGLDLDAVVTNPGFGRSDHGGLARYAAGEGKEGVGMGGALALADREGVGMDDVRDRTVALCDRVVTEGGS